MSKRFNWARSIPRSEPAAPPAPIAPPVAEEPPAASVATILPAVRPVMAAVEPPPVVPEPPARRSGERLIDRRDGRARSATRYVPGRIRGGKHSGQWGRGSSDLAPGDWIGVRLPPGTNARLKRMAAAHDLYLWQVIVESIDLFIATHGEEPNRKS
jgi:hypothetical protein